MQGGTNVYPVTSSNMEQVIEAVEYLANNVTDPKAAAVLIFDYQNNSVILFFFFSDRKGI